MKVLPASLAFNFGDGENLLADEARGRGVTYWGRTADAPASTPRQEAPGRPVPVQVHGQNLDLCSEKSARALELM